MTVKTYQEIALQKVAERDAKFPKEWIIPQDQLPAKSVKDVTKFPVESGLLTAKEIEITESDVKTLLAKIHGKEWTSYEATKAFAHRATIAHQLVNCLSEVFIEEGLEQAKALDEHYEKTGELVGPFHGLPMSLKDNLNVKGQATTIGFTGFCYNPEGGFDEDSALVKILRNMGCVFYVKTNVPTAMMMAETYNNVYGRTLNPMNRDLSCGGSSGGEAAILSLKGAPLGVGSDIGGSIRIPASFQNLYGLRPSFGRFPTYGARSGLPGLVSVNSVNGPLSPSIETIELYCKHVLSSKPNTYDGKVIDLPWRDVELPKKLVFGVCYDDGYVRPTPPIRRGMKEAVEKIKAAGHEVIEWKLTDHVRLADIITAYFLADGGKHCKEYNALSGEPFPAGMKMYGEAEEMGVSELWDLQAENTTLLKKYVDRWNATSELTSTGKPIDAILLPASPYAAVAHDKFGYVGYTSPFNALDYSAGTLPVSRVDPEIDVEDVDYTPRNEIDESVWKSYNAKESVGGPISVQVACRRMEDEKVIAILKELDKIIEYKA